MNIHPSGRYRYLPAIAPYSSGIAAEPGYRILGVQFDTQPGVAAGFSALDAELDRRGLPASAVAGCHLRSPTQFSFGGFDEFNVTYQQLLTERGLIIDGVNPVSRTNVVPQYSPPGEVVIAAAFLVVAADRTPGTATAPDPAVGGGDFVVAGAGEVGELGPDSIIAPGEVSPSGLIAKSEFVIEQMSSRLTALGFSGDDPTTVNVYTVHQVPELAERLAGRLGGTRRWGYTHWSTSPPITGLEFEMDCARVSSWICLDGTG